jgi:hypothetical protein
MDNATQQAKDCPPDVEKVAFVTLRKDELIDILKALEGLKKKLQYLIPKTEGKI